VRRLEVERNAEMQDRLKLLCTAQVGRRRRSPV
jgi:hypothetical protein